MLVGERILLAGVCGAVWLTSKIKSETKQCSLGWIGLCGSNQRQFNFLFSTLKSS